MKIASVVLHGNFTDGMAYQENCLPYYQKKVFGADIVIIAGQYSLKTGSNESVVNAPGEYTCFNGIRLIRIANAKDKISRKLAYMPSLYDLLEKEQPDYIFAHLIQSISIRDIIRYKKRHPEVTLYGDSHADHINSAHGWFSTKILHGIIWKHILKEAAPYFEKIYGVLPARVSFLKEMYNLPNNKIDLLLMGAEDELIDYKQRTVIRKIIRENLKLNENDFVIITGGKIDERKNIKVLVDAIESFKDNHVKLLLFGKPDDKMLEYMDEIKRKDYIRNLGWIDSKKMYEYFHASDLCVFPGTHSVVWEQAVGYGLPGVFRHWDGIEHIDLHGNMRFFYNKSVSEMINILKKIIYTKEIYEKMRTCAENVSNNFHYSTLALKSLGGDLMNQSSSKQVSEIMGGGIKYTFASSSLDLFDFIDEYKLYA